MAVAWNGAAWRIQSTPNPGGTTSSYLNGVSCSSAKACIAGGYYVTVHRVTLADTWNGAAWKAQSTPNP